MVVFNGRDDRAGEADIFQDRRTHRGVDLGLFHFGPGQFSGLVQDMVGHGEFAYIVEESSGLQSFDIALADPSTLPIPTA